MRAFLNSMALMLFVFALVIAFFTFSLVEVDMHNSAQPSLVVEQARWYEDARAYDCQSDAVLDGNSWDGMQSGIQFSYTADTTSADYYLNDIVAIEEQFERNYAPAVEIFKVQEVVPDLKIVWEYCDPDGDTPTFDVKVDGIACCSATPPPAECSCPKPAIWSNVTVIASDGQLVSQTSCYDVGCPP